MKKPKQPQAPEFFRPIALAGLNEGENVIEIAAEEGERAALAKRFELTALRELSVRYTIWPMSGGTGARAVGHLKADVEQACVVTLQPVRSRIEADFERHFAEGNALESAGEEAFVDPEEQSEPPDPVVNGAVDLGECAAEQLALEIDPFPRAAGAEFRGFSSGVDTPPNDGDKPFAALAKLKGKL